MEDKYMLDYAKYESENGDLNAVSREILEPVIEDAEKRLYSFIMGYIFM